MTLQDRIKLVGKLTSMQTMLPSMQTMLPTTVMQPKGEDLGLVLIG